MHIRTAKHLDHNAVRAVHMSAFGQNERDIIARLALDLLSARTGPASISLVAECDRAIVGHIAFSPVKIGGDAHLRGSILAPLGIKPEYQKRGIGSKLIENGMQRLAATGIHILFVYGDPAYYGRFGFSADSAAVYIPPYALPQPFGWQAVALNAHTPQPSPVSIACVEALCDPAIW